MSSCSSAERYDCARPDISASFQQIRHQGDGGPLEWSCSFIKKDHSSLFCTEEIFVESNLTRQAGSLHFFVWYIRVSIVASLPSESFISPLHDWPTHFSAPSTNENIFFFFLKSILTSVSIKTCTSASTVLTALAFAWKTSADKMKGHRRFFIFTNQVPTATDNQRNKVYTKR